MFPSGDVFTALVQCEGKAAGFHSGVIIFLLKLWCLEHCILMSNPALALGGSIAFPSQFLSCFVASWQKDTVVCR